MKSKYALLAGIAFELTGLILFFSFIGYQVEKSYPFHGLIMAGFILFGFCIWLFHLIQIVKKWDL